MIAVSALIAVRTAAQFLDAGLSVARALGLPVETWRAGDPTRALFKYLAEVLAVLDPVVAEYVRSGFLSEARGEWLTVLASELYGVERIGATPSTPSITLTNGGGGFYPLDVGDLIVKSSISDATFRSTTGGTLSPGATVTFDLVADVAGSESTVSTDEIDEIVTPLLGVAINGSTAAIGTDEQDDDALKTQCRSTLGALSPNGPPDAYEFVARNPDLTGRLDVTRARSIDDSDTGDVIVYVAGADGAVAGDAITDAQAAIERWATPLCVIPEVRNATEVNVNVTATVEGDDLPPDVEARVAVRLEAFLAALPISDGDDVIARSLIVAEIHRALPEAFRVTLTAPVADVTLALGSVATLGAVSVTEV